MLGVAATIARKLRAHAVENLCLHTSRHREDAHGTVGTVLTGQFDNFLVIALHRKDPVFIDVAVKTGLLGKAGIEASLLSFGFARIGQGAATANESSFRALDRLGQLFGLNLKHEAFA